MTPQLRTLGRTAVALTLGLVLTAPAATATAGPAAPVATTSSQQLDSAALQAALDALTAGPGVGAVAQVVGPQGTWSSASGVRRLGGDQPAARRNDRVRIASVTKSMVATLALQEVQRGRWTLSTRVRDVLPGLLPGHGDVTLAQLLSHRSGLPDYLSALVADATTADAFLDVISRRYTDRQLVRVALTQPWGFTPGSSFSYSNTNYVVVGLMLARENDRSVRSLLQRRVFDRANMQDSSFPRTPRITGRHLTEYAVFDRAYSLASLNPSIFSSAGAVVSTPRDVNRFYAALLSGRLLRPALVKQMRTPRTTASAYGLGIYALPDPCPTRQGKAQLVYGHDGGSFGTLTLAMSSPDRRRQFTVSVTGRLYDPAATPLPINAFATTALLATCTTAPAPRSTQTRAQQDSQLTVPWMDAAATLR